MDNYLSPGLSAAKFVFVSKISQQECERVVLTYFRPRKEIRKLLFPADQYRNQLYICVRVLIALRE